MLYSDTVCKVISFQSFLLDDIKWTWVMMLMLCTFSSLICTGHQRLSCWPYEYLVLIRFKNFNSPTSWVLTFKTPHSGLQDNGRNFGITFCYSSSWILYTTQFVHNSICWFMKSNNQIWKIQDNAGELSESLAIRGLVGRCSARRKTWR